MANLWVASNDKQKAKASYEESLAIMRRLVAGDPGNAEWQGGLVMSLLGFGMGTAAVDLPRARAALSEALALVEGMEREGKLTQDLTKWPKVIREVLAVLNPAHSTSIVHIPGTYEGIDTISQVPGEHRISLRFQQFGTKITATYGSSLGGYGRGIGTISDNGIGTMSLQSETEDCPGSYTASVRFSEDVVSWTYAGQDCGGPVHGRGTAKKTKP
jgi:hypothetical protein